MKLCWRAAESGRQSTQDADTTRLVELCRQGDRTAFSGLVRTFKNYVFALAFQHVRNRLDAEDVAQEAFLRAYRDIGRLRKAGAFAGWLAGIVANVASERARRKTVTTVPLESVPEPRAAGTENEEEGKAASLLALVARLPEKYRLPIVLRYSSGLRYVEIGRIMGISENGARSRVHRGRALLRRMRGRA